MSLDCFYVLAFVVVCVVGCIEFGKATRHDARLEPAEAVDWDAIEEERDTKDADDCDSWRKGERCCSVAGTITAAGMDTCTGVFESRGIGAVTLTSWVGGGASDPQSSPRPAYSAASG
jgi:hypothetical protein